MEDHITMQDLEDLAEACSARLVAAEEALWRANEQVAVAQQLLNGAISSKAAAVGQAVQAAHEKALLQRALTRFRADHGDTGTEWQGQTAQAWQPWTGPMAEAPLLDGWGNFSWTPIAALGASTALGPAGASTADAAQAPKLSWSAVLNNDSCSFSTKGSIWTPNGERSDAGSWAGSDMSEVSAEWWRSNEWECKVPDSPVLTGASIFDFARAAKATKAAKSDKRGASKSRSSSDKGSTTDVNGAGEDATDGRDGNENKTRSGKNKSASVTLASLDLCEEDKAAIRACFPAASAGKAATSASRKAPVRASNLKEANRNTKRGPPAKADIAERIRGLNAEIAQQNRLGMVLHRRDARARHSKLSALKEELKQLTKLAKTAA